MEVVGRDRERGAVGEVVSGAAGGRGGALVLRGGPGVGKTVLLDLAVAEVDPAVVTRVAGVEAEVALPFGALHRLLVPFLDRRDALTPTQATALTVACGLDDGPAVDPAMVGLAALSLVAGADDGHVLVVDDAHWVDPDSLRALGVLGRRMHAEGTALLIATRAPATPGDALEGLPDLIVEGLDPRSALDLLLAVVDGPLEARLAERIVAATEANPLALRELGAELAARHVDEASLLVDPVPVGPRLEDHYRRRVAALPEATRRWLVLAAAEPAGDLGYVSAAAAAEGLDLAAATPAEADGLVRLGATVGFRHPLVRSAIYRGAPTADRWAAHAALAAVTERPSDADRRAWHRAAASPGPDAGVADELEATAGRAGERGGLATRAAWLVRSADLTADPVRRVGRLLDAAESALGAGNLPQAVALVDRVDGEASDDPVVRGRGLVVRAEWMMLSGEPGGTARSPAVLLAAGRDLGVGDVDRCRLALLRAAAQLMMADVFAVGIDLDALGDAVADHLASSPAAGADTFGRPALDAIATLARSGPVAATDPMQAALAVILDPATDDEVVLAHFVLATTFCTITLDDVRRMELLDRAATVARKTGALRALDAILYSRSMAHTNMGDLAAADRDVVDGHLMRAALGASDEVWQIYRHPELLAWRGDTPELEMILDATAEAATTLGNGAVVDIVGIGRVIRALGLGDYGQACDVARSMCDRELMGLHTRVLPDLVEAAVRCGESDLAAQAAADLVARATAGGTPWGRGLAVRSQALLASGAEADALYTEAIDRLAATTGRADLARAHLVYGEWLRRVRRTSDAREQLAVAHGMFAALGAPDYAERARVELAATGETVRRSRPAAAGEQLTPQEDQVARLAAEGLTNAEIAERLYISARTVDYHLRKVFRKLAIRSRRDLRGHAALR